jgi:predicted RNA-binding Zn ribbon-like protein
LPDAFDKPWSGMGIGGSLALDFANTVDWRLRENPTDSLRDYSDLLRWSRTAGILTPVEARRLRTASRTRPAEAARAMADAVQVREAIAALFQAVTRGDALPQAPLKRLDEACRQAAAARTLKPAGAEAAWTWRPDASPAHRTAWAVALDGARLLTSPARERVRECGDAACGWLFLDTSRNRSRRWCTMEGCGNRNKARSFYRRTAGGGKRGRGE